MSNSVTIEGTASPVRDLNLRGLLGIPAVRQVLLLVGVAAAVATGFAIVLWSQSPGYTRLYGNLAASDVAAVAQALESAGIEHRVDVDTGSVSVPAARLHDARLELASRELPKGGSVGMEMLADSPGFGVSQFMESARYQHALEAELARTISHLGVVQNARVHLAIPRHTSFLRDQRQASASVLLELYRGRSLEPDQASAIVHLVATSVPNLDPGRVTVIDQHGRLLSGADGNADAARSMESFRRARELEEIFRRRIEELLTPLVGPGRVRAQVVADLDFTVTERVQESYDPAKSALRSEQVSIERQDAVATAATGIPGALSNQPPGEGAPAAAAEGEASRPVDVSEHSTRNYELDRTISHVRPESGRIERLSVAVLVDDSPPDGEAAAEYPPLTDADIERFTALVREAVGFRAERGDSVVVVKAAFREDAAPPGAPEPALWDKPVLRDALKQILGAVLVLAIAFGIVRPLLRNLVGGPAPAAALVAQGGAAPAPASRLPGTRAALAGPSFDEKIAAARSISGHDPARVAQVVKKWVNGDGQ
jgi:flagellar M-ring protein FliF